MYSWGGSTADWKGSKKYDYGSARARYDRDAADAGISARTYNASREPNMDLVDPRGKTIKTDSTDPIIVGVDVTGSMATWPGEIFDRLPLLYQTLAKYKPGAEFAFCAIGDATCDNYPLQVNNFTKNIKDLEAAVKALGAEGMGGGHITESYELFGHYMLNHCQTPNATSPFLLIYGDEAFYPNIDPRQVKHWVGDDLQNPLKSDKMWQELMQKFNLYFMQKPYGRGDDDITHQVKNIWGRSIGLQRIVDVPDPERAVDIGMGLIAKNWGEYKDFSVSLDARHDDPSIKASVHQSLRYIDAAPSAKSITKKTVTKTTRSLLD